MNSSIAGQGLLALNRFGLGARPGDLSSLSGDPRGSVEALADPRAVTPPEAAPGFPPLLSGAENYVRARLAQLEKASERARPAPTGRDAQPGMPGSTAAGQQPGPAGQPPGQEAFRSEIAARFSRLAQAENGLVERLVLFWSNHFSVSVTKGLVRAVAGAFEREAIRPHVLGRFGDMLRAVEQHPAMLDYLDASQSIGPGSRAGLRNRRGLNENLAREILELHTLGVGGGYTQQDVTSLARIITGWTVTPPAGDPAQEGRFAFVPARHEPGDQVLLGRVYRDDGPAQGEAALADLAVHPATARHLAGKLARHFVADDPPGALVDRLAATFLATGGDLLAVTRTLVGAPEAWDAPARKLRTPQEFLVAALRALGAPAEPGAVVQALTAMGQPPWRPPGPNGFADASAAWTSPEGMAARLDIASTWGRRHAGADPKALLDAVIGPAASPDTRQAVARAESRAQGVALLLMSPEFQRR